VRWAVQPILAGGSIMIMAGRLLVNNPSGQGRDYAQEVHQMLKEFRDFVNKGNVLDLAVAVVLGAAFTAVINSFVKDVLMQIIAAIFGKPDFSSLTFTLGNAVIFYGNFINAVITFLLVALSVFLIVRAYNRMRQPAPENTKECPYCLSTIPLGATRCPNCTSQLTGDVVSQPQA
jgi:large conductance mechanosensitive channel